MAMMKPLDIPPLGISEKEAQSHFEALQGKLVPLWECISHFSETEQTIVVIPSITFDFDCQGAEMQAYEERMLFMLLLLKQPRARLVYTTSQTILPSTLDYYLSIMPGVVNRHAMTRFFNVAVEDRSPRPLTIKILERPHVCERIRSLILDPDRAHLVAFNVTRYERDLVLRLGIPIYGADPSFWHLGSKTGSRQIFAQCGVSHPIGYENLRTWENVLQALSELRQQKPLVKEAMVKLNDSVGGEGNAMIDFTGLPASNSLDSTTGLEERLRSMCFESSRMTFERFF